MSINNLDNITVTVIVPVYNVQEYIRECIMSIQAQTHTNLEIIIVNDGTKDDSINVIQDLIKMDSRIQVITQKNQGLSAARNTGLEKATGKYIAMIDSDDAIKPKFITHLLKTAEDKNADIVRGSFRDFDGNIPSNWVPDFNTSFNNGIDVLSQFLDNNTSFVVWSSIYSTEFLNKNKLRFTSGILLEDGDFTTRAYIAAKNVVMTDHTDYQYRIRPGSILTTNNSQKMSDSEAQVIESFNRLHDAESFLYTQHIYDKAIYAFMRDWTRILTKNKIKLTKNQKKIFHDSLKDIDVVIARRPMKERIKFRIKLFVIKLKYRMDYK